MGGGKDSQCSAAATVQQRADVSVRQLQRRAGCALNSPSLPGKPLLLSFPVMRAGRELLVTSGGGGRRRDDLPGSHARHAEAARLRHLPHRMAVLPGGGGRAGPVAGAAGEAALLHCRFRAGPVRRCCVPVGSGVCAFFTKRLCVGSMVCSFSSAFSRALPLMSSVLRLPRGRRSCGPPSFRAPRQSCRRWRPRPRSARCWSSRPAAAARRIGTRSSTTCRAPRRRSCSRCRPFRSWCACALDVHVSAVGTAVCPVAYTAACAPRLLGGDARAFLLTPQWRVLPNVTACWEGCTLPCRGG